MARDGWLFVGPSLLVLIGGALGIVRDGFWGWPVAILGLLGTIAFAFFFRDPGRVPPSDSDAVVATADGKILSVENLPDGGLQIDTFLSVLNVHVNRAPVGGKVTESVHRPGQYHPAFATEAGQTNERHDLVIESPLGRIRSAQIAGILARRIVCRPRAGDQVRCGDRIGIIRFGSRAQVILPPGFAPLVKNGDRVRAGESIIARQTGIRAHA
ncbi:MAG TPA: phosphatidylserine decarboxylase [Acidobacteriota bacterium]|nr:phosphatidylserine decarboxylase [Acidobacteriota bacterium]